MLWKDFKFRGVDDSLPMSSLEEDSGEIFPLDYEGRHGLVTKSEKQVVDLGLWGCGLPTGSQG